MTSTNRISTSDFTHDAAGNLTNSGAGKTYQRDAEGRMKSINNSSGGTCTAVGMACTTYNGAWPSL